MTQPNKEIKHSQRPGPACHTAACPTGTSGLDAESARAQAAGRWPSLTLSSPQHRGIENKNKKQKHSLQDGTHMLRWAPEPRLPNLFAGA